MFKILTYSQSIRSIYFFNNSQKHVHVYACVGKPATRKPAITCGLRVPPTNSHPVAGSNLNINDA